MGAGAIPAGASALNVPDHSTAFRTRRFLNWFPLGLTYAFLYMGRYNLNVAKNALGTLMTEEDFGLIFAAGTVVYGFAFLANGPLTDKIGGKKAMLIAAIGSAVANLAMGWYILEPSTRSNGELRLWFSMLYAANMYFQSFGAVAIVKVNASWFHVRERGGFSGIFGTMIASGIWMAYSLNGWILAGAAKAAGTTELAQAKVVFFIPAVLLLGMFLLELFLLKDRPGQAGHADFDTGDASSGDHGDVPVRTIIKRILTHPIILTVALIEFCTGVVRQGVMQWYPFYAKSVLSLPSGHYMRQGEWPSWGLWALAGAVIGFVVGATFRVKGRGWFVTMAGLVFLAPFVPGGWGGLLFVAGVIGGNVAGHVSDLFFQSRRAPAAGGLYGVLVLGTLAMAVAMPKVTNQIDETKVPGLMAGDKIVAVGSQTGLEDWVAVRQAFKAIPPQECLLGSKWDPVKKVCSIKPAEGVETLAPSTGVIPVVVERGGQRVTVELQDWAAKQRAGEPRVLKATPVATVPPYLLGAVVIVMSLCVIGTHGLLSGTATMDFGGRKGAATAVGMIDGFVYLGTAVQSVSLGYLTARNWGYWPWFMLPFSVIGFLLCLRIWNAKPAARAAPATAPAPSSQPAPLKTGTGGR